MADFDEIQSNFEEEDFVLCTKELQEYHLQQLHEIFDVTEQIPQDLMHVILDGSLKTIFSL